MLGSTTRLNQTEPGQTSYNQSKSDRSSLNETKPEYRPTPTRPGLKPEQITTEQIRFNYELLSGRNVNLLITLGTGSNDLPVDNDRNWQSQDKYANQGAESSNGLNKENSFFYIDICG